MDDKIFYNPGDIVTIKHDLDNKPIMFIIKKEKRHIVGEQEESFIGFTCGWFDKNNQWNTAIFSTKDLIKI